jgi:hypothetical protein
MPTTLRTAAVARWVGRGNGPSRVTGANACPAAGDCYKDNYPHRALGAARLNTAQRRLSTAQRMTRHRISRIRSGFTARRAAKGDTGCGSPQFSMRSGARMARQAPARDRMSPLWQIMAHSHFGHWTAGRTRKARRSPTVDDSQRGPTDSGTIHRMLLGHITDFRGGSVERRKRCYFDIGLSVAIFLLNGLPPKEKNDTSQINSPQVTDEGREEWKGNARVRRSSRWTANGRATLEMEQHRRCGCRQWVPVVRGSSARSGVRWHGQLHRALLMLVQRGIDRGSHSRTRLACGTCEGAGNQCRATSSLYQTQPRTQRIGHWSRGAVRTTYWHSFAFHVSLPVNRSHKPGNRMDGRQQCSISTYEGDSDQCVATSRRTLRTGHVRDGQERDFDINRFTPRHLQQQGVLVIAVCLSAGNAYDDASGWYWITERHKAGVGTQRTRNRSKGTVRTTCRHLGAFHVSLSANRGRTPGSSEKSRGYYWRVQQIRHRSRGTAQTTFWHLGALHVSLAGNRDRTLVNCPLSPLGNLACDTSTRATYLFLDHLRHGNQSRMSTLGTHDKPLRGRGPVLLALRSVGCYVDKT